MKKDLSYRNWGVKGAESLARGWIAPLYLNTSLPKFLLVTLTTLLPSSIEGLMGLWEEQPSSSFLSRGLGDVYKRQALVPLREILVAPPTVPLSPQSSLGGASLALSLIHI